MPTDYIGCRVPGRPHHPSGPVHVNPDVTEPGAHGGRAVGSASVITLRVLKASSWMQQQRSFPCRCHSQEAVSRRRIKTVISIASRHHSFTEDISWTPAAQLMARTHTRKASQSTTGIFLFLDELLLRVLLAYKTAKRNLSAYLTIQGAAKKVIPCRIFQIFKQPPRIFLTKLCYYILCSYWHMNAKYCLIILKYDKVVRFQTRQPPSFDVVKNIKQTRTHNKLYK